MTIALGTTVMDSNDGEVGQQVELTASHHPGADEMDAYERVLGDAIGGDRALFARQDYVEEAWRIVDPVLKKETPVYEYGAGSWGPREVNEHVCSARRLAKSDDAVVRPRSLAVLFAWGHTNTA